MAAPAWWSWPIRRWCSQPRPQECAPSAALDRDRCGATNAAGAACEPALCRACRSRHPATDASEWRQPFSDRGLRTQWTMPQHEEPHRHRPPRHGFQDVPGQTPEARPGASDRDGDSPASETAQPPDLAPLDLLGIGSPQSSLEGQPASSTGMPSAISRSRASNRLFPAQTSRPGHSPPAARESTRAG